MEKTNDLDFVYSELDARKGGWAEIARTIEPDSWESYYSWLTKFARKKIPGASFQKVQRLADHFRAHPR